MRKLLAALMSALLFSCHPVPAGAADSFVASEGGVTMTLRADAPCEIERAKDVPGARGGTVESKGETPIKVCWLEHDDHIDGVTDTGYPFQIPISRFERMLSVDKK